MLPWLRFSSSVYSRLLLQFRLEMFLTSPGMFKTTLDLKSLHANCTDSLHMVFAISGSLQQSRLYLKFELYGLSVFGCLWPWKASFLKDDVMAVARWIRG